MKKLYTLVMMMAVAASMMAADVTVYCKNAAGWATVNAYVWTPEVKAWPGEAMQKTSVDNVYAYTITNGATNIVFNAGSGTQTADLTVEPGKCYNNSTKVWENAPEGITIGGGNGGNGGGNGGGNTTPEGEAYYYYKGFVNGVDIQGNEFWNMFSEGVVEYDFTADKNYLFVIEQVDGVPGVQYMAGEYTEDTHAKMLKTGNEKLMVPKGKGTLYLYDNGDGSLELSTVVIPGKKLVGGGTTAIENTTTAVKAVKTILNGQIVIEKAGVRYNAFGQTIN